MAAVRSEERICPIEAIPEYPVNCAWDLGVSDDTSIWFFQNVGSQIYILDHYAASGVGLEHYAEQIELREKQHGWKHGTDFVPHDAKIREWGSGKTRIETMSRMGLRPMLVPHSTVADGINAVRRILPLCVFHPRCEEGGITALEQYRREWDDDKKAFRASAVHDWTSHPSDSFRYLAMARAPAHKVKPKEMLGFEGLIIPPPRDEPRRGIML
jgi:hypothetical protein